jgi:hypothetical protein
MFRELFVIFQIIQILKQMQYFVLISGLVQVRNDIDVY